MELLPSQHHIYACLMDEINLLPPKGMLCFCSATQLLSEILFLQFPLIPPAISLSLLDYYQEFTKHLPFALIIKKQKNSKTLKKE